MDALVADSGEWHVLNQASEMLGTATPTEISQFFSDRKPWEFSDWFIFNSAMSVCIVLTHDNLWLLCRKTPHVPERLERS